MKFLHISNIYYINILKGALNLKKRLKKSFGHSKLTGRQVFFKKKKTLFRQIYIFIDFWRCLNTFGYILAIRRDLNRSAYICIICYMTGILVNSILVEKVKLGQRVFSGRNFEDARTKLLFFQQNHFFITSLASKDLIVCTAGNSIELNLIPLGIRVSLLEIWNKQGAQFCRSAGTFAVVLKKTKEKVTLKMKSGWLCVVNGKCIVTVGIVSNVAHCFKQIRKAGTSQNLGRRVTVRGVAMNAVDHPHGGGRGKSSIGKKPMSPWGKLTKWCKTVKRSI